MIFETSLIVVLACILDALLGEARRCHPLSGFGYLAQRLEHRLNGSEKKYRKAKGVLALIILVFPLMLALILINFYQSSAAISSVIGVVILYFAIGRKSLSQHALAIMWPLLQNNLHQARQAVGLIVSRDTAQMDQQQITTAALESIFENSNDAIFGAIFWFLVAGAPGVLMYRLTNTLDAMWGYKNSRYQQFGWAAARFDDVLNWLPSRLTVFSFAILSHFSSVWHLAFKQGLQCSSKNGGPVMAAGACALMLTLGGRAQYEGVVIEKPELGCGKSPTAIDIKRALILVNKTLFLWISVLVLIDFIKEII